MKLIIILSLQILFCISTISQWSFEANLPYDSLHEPIVWQVNVIDSSVSWAFGNVHVNQNYDFPYFARRSTTGWSFINTDLNPSVRGYCFTARDSSNIWLGTLYPEEIFYSSNGGVNWILQCHISDTAYVEGIMFSREFPEIGYTFADIGHNGMWSGVRILKTTNSGQNWIIWEFENYGFKCADGSMSLVDSNYAWFGVSNIFGGLAKIIMTSNGGMNWIITDINAGYSGPFTIQFSDNNQTGLFVGQTGITSWFYRTTNSGFNWSSVYTTNNYYSKTMRWVPGTSNIYGNSEFIIVRSIDNGATWSVMSGAANSHLSSMDAVRINYGTIYSLAVTWDSRVYKLLDSARVIGIENLGTTIPKEFKVYQNYPNPFNPSTTIKFDLPKDSRVSIKIYDILGREIAVLADNEFKNAGSYKVEWNASSFSSGVYFYRIEADGIVVTKSMILVK